MASGGRFGRSLARVLLPEFLDTTGCIDDFLLAGIERVAGRADFHMKIAVQRGTRGPRVAATAGDGDLAVFGVYLGLHRSFLARCAGAAAFWKAADYGRFSLAKQGPLTRRPVFKQCATTAYDFPSFSGIHPGKARIAARYAERNKIQLAGTHLEFETA